MQKLPRIVLTCLAVASFVAPAMGQEVSPTRSISSPCAPPEYPRAALANEEEGVVKLSLLITPDGRVTDFRIDKTSGSRSLDKAAIAGYSKCQFKPGTKDGKPDSLWMSMQFEFKLK